MANDGTISIKIEVDGKQVSVAAKELDKLEEAGLKSGKGIKSAESSMDSLSDKSAKAGSSVKGAGNAIEGLGESGAKAGKGLKGADGAIDELAGSSADASKGVKGVSDSLEGMSGKANEAANSAKRVKEETESVSQNTNKASIGIKELATSLGLVAIASAAFNTLKSSLDSAISRFDTLNAFPKVLQALGVSAEDSERAMARLSDGIDGLPTTLNDIAGSAQRMYTSFSDMDKATDTAIALNNALLGSGSSAEDAKRGADQYIKALQSGKIQMDTWNTLSETMDVGLIKIAEGFGFAGKSAKDDLYKALKSNEISLEQFNDKLIEVGTGTGIMATLARENSLGIATSLGNLGNAAARGVANIIDSFNKLAIATTGKDIAQNIDSLKVVVNSSFKVIGSVIEGAAPTVKVFASAVQASIPVVKALSPAIIGLMTAYAAYTVISKASAAIEASNKVLAIAQASQKALTLATSAQIAAQAASTTATTADTVAKAAQSGTISMTTLAIGVMTGSISASTAAQVIATTASYAFGAAIKFLMGPIGWITAAIGLLVTGVIALVKWFNKSTEEGERLSKQTDELASATEALNTSVEDSAKSYEKRQQQVESNAEANAQLAAQIEELAAKENKSAEDKKMLSSYIEELNRNVSDLNLVYGEESNALSMTSEQLMNRINLMKEEEKLQASQERLTEIIKEQNEIGFQLKEVNELREEWNQKLEDGSVKSKEHKEAIKSLEEQEKALSEAHTAAGEERLRVEDEIVKSSAAVTAATEKDIGRQLLLYDELPESVKKAVESMNSSWQDYMNAATNMFDKISEKSELSVAEMQKNLEENQRIITQWSENIAKLAERGVDEGLLNTLREAGPESAGHVNALVKASDTELQKLSETFAKGGSVATEALNTSLGIEESGIMEAVGHLVAGTEKALADKVKAAEFDKIGVDVAKGQAKGIEDGTPEVEKAATEMAKSTEDAARKQLETHSPSKVFERIGTDLDAGLILGIKNGTKAVLEAVNTLIKNTVKPFDKMPSDFEKIGEDAMAGMNRGLKSGEKQVLATAKSIADSAANTMRKALDIHSPSRVFEEIGKDTMRGNVVGIESQKEANRKAILGVAKVLSDAGRKNAAEISKIAEDAEKKRTQIQNDYAKKRAELAKKTASSSQAALKTHKDKKGQIVTSGEQKVYKIRSDASAKLTKLNEEEQKKLAAVNERAWNDMVKKENELAKERLAAVKTYVDDKKSLNELSLVAESEVWRKSLALFAEGTKERVEIQKNYQAALKTINNEITKTNEEYAGKMQKINDTLRNEEQKLTDEYTKSVEDRTKALTNFVSIFDAYEYKFEQTGEELTKNLRSQVLALEGWQHAIETLSQRAIDKGLLAELREMGPKALPQLIALNQMTDRELTDYSELYKKKSQLARQQAEKELIGMKADTEKRIEDLRRAANKELETLRREWTEKIKSVTKATDDEMMTLKTIGRNAGQGLLDGLSSMESSLVRKAQSIAESVKAAMADALDIHSPSRWMRDFIAGNMAVGFIKGIDKYESKVLKATGRFGEMLKPDMQSISIPNIDFRPFNPSFGGGVGTGSSTTDNRKTFAPRITNHFTPAESTPAESARKQKQQLQRLAMEF